jgi:hypothetical protein
MFQLCSRTEREKLKSFLIENEKFDDEPWEVGLKQAGKSSSWKFRGGRISAGTFKGFNPD